MCNTHSLIHLHLVTTYQLSCKTCKTCKCRSSYQDGWTTLLILSSGGGLLHSHIFLTGANFDILTRGRPRTHQEQHPPKAEAEENGPAPADEEQPLPQETVEPPQDTPAAPRRPRIRRRLRQEQHPPYAEAEEDGPVPGQADQDGEPR